MVSISHILDEQRSIFDTVLLCPLHCLSDHQYVLSIALKSWNSISSCVIVRVMCGTSIGSSHTIKIIFTKEYTWKFPECSHVSSLENLSLICCTISIHCNSNIWLFLIFKSKSETSSYGNLSSDNTITTIEIIL